MLMRTDPFRELDRLARLWETGIPSGPTAVPMDAYRHGDDFVVCFDLPGVAPDSIELTVERNVLTVRADRMPAYAEGDEVLVTERPGGSFTRQLFLGETLDTDRLAARYDNGVLTITIPVAEQAKPRRVSVTSGSQPGGQRIIEAQPEGRHDQQPTTV